MSQLEDKLGSVDIELSEDEVERFSGTTESATLYPQWMVEFMSADR